MRLFLSANLFLGFAAYLIAGAVGFVAAVLASGTEAQPRQSNLTIAAAGVVGAVICFFLWRRVADAERWEETGRFMKWLYFLAPPWGIALSLGFGVLALFGLAFLMDWPARNRVCGQPRE